MIRKNLWVIEYVPNQTSQIILNFLEWTDYNSLDELVNIPSKTMVNLISIYEAYLQLSYKPSTIEGKMKALYYFCYKNGLKIKDVYAD